MKKLLFIFKQMIALTLCAMMSFSMASYISLSKKSGMYSEVNAKTKKVGLSTQSLTLSLGKTFTIKFYGAKKVKWESRNKKIATISKSGKIKAKKIGKTKIVCYANNKKYFCQLKVVKPRVQLNYKKLILKQYGKIKLKLLNAKGKVTWKSDNKRIATVNQKGIVLAKKVGRTTIRAKHKKKLYKCKITVVKINKQKKSPATNNSSPSNNKSNSSDMSNNSSELNNDSLAKNNVTNNTNMTNNSTDSLKNDANKANNDSSKIKEDDNNNTNSDTVDNNDESRNNVFVKNEVKIIPDDSKDTKSTMKEIHNTIVDFYSSKDEDGNDFMNFIVSNDSPLYQYIQNGLYKNGDIIYIEPNKYFIAGLSVKYISHDDQYQEGMSYNVDNYEVIHTMKASLNDMYSGNMNIESDTFDQNDPIAFSWTPTVKKQTVSPVLKKARMSKKLLANTKEVNPTLSSNAADEKAPDSNTDSNDKSKMVVLPNIDEAVSFTPTNAKQFLENSEIKYNVDNLVLFDKDGDLDTTNDQVTLSGYKNIEKIAPKLKCDWKLGSLPTALVAKLTYDENTQINLHYGAQIGDISSVIKELNTNLLGDSIDNKINLSLFGFVNEEISGIDLSDRIMLAAFGLRVNLATQGVAPVYKDIYKNSSHHKLSPILFLLVTLDMDGNIKFDFSANYEENKYIEKGVNIYNDDGYDEIDHSHEDKKFNVGDETISYLNVQARSRDEDGLDEDPDSTLTLKGEGTYEYKDSLNASCGVMFDTVIPAYINAEAGIKGSGYIAGKLEKTSDSEWDIDGGISMKNRVFAEVTGLVKINIEGDIEKLNNSIDKSWTIFSCTLAEKNWSTFDFKGIYYITDDKKKIGINDAKVVLESTDDDTKYKAATDENGNFKVSNILIGTYDISVTKRGYTPIRKTITLSIDNLEFDGETTVYQGKTPTGDLSLTKDDFNAKSVNGVSGMYLNYIDYVEEGHNTSYWYVNKKWQGGADDMRGIVYGSTYDEVIDAFGNPINELDVDEDDPSYDEIDSSDEAVSKIYYTQTFNDKKYYLLFYFDEYGDMVYSLNANEDCEYILSDIL